MKKLLSLLLLFIVGFSTVFATVDNSYDSRYSGEIKILQMEKAISQKIEHSKILYDTIDNETIQTAIINYQNEMNLLLDELSDIDNLTDEEIDTLFEQIKEQSIELTTELRNEIHEVIPIEERGMYRNDIQNRMQNNSVMNQYRGLIQNKMQEHRDFMKQYNLGNLSTEEKNQMRMEMQEHRDEMHEVRNNIRNSLRPNQK